jgi:hypothetical protein
MDSRTMKALGVLEICTAVGIVTFWALFFTVGLAPQGAPDCYEAYEHSFVGPDALLAVCLLVSGVLLVKGRRWGLNLSTACGGGLVFLGAADIGFNLMNGVYAASFEDLVLNAAVNLWCAGAGLLFVIAPSRAGGDVHEGP